MDSLTAADFPDVIDVAPTLKVQTVAVIPAYNEEKTIAKVIVSCQRYVDKVIVCDDGSEDMTAEIAQKLGAEVIRYERNMGYGEAMRSLFKKARELDAEVMIVLDADDQHDPSQIPSVMAPILKGDADIVVGTRFVEGNKTPGYRATGIRVITDITDMLSGLELNDAQCGFRAYSRTAFSKIMPSEMGMGVSTEILLKAADLGLKVVEVPVSVEYEGLETSKLNPLYHGLDVIASTVKHYSIRHPLMFYGIPGLMALLVAAFFWLWTLDIFATTRQVITNITLIAIGTTIIGLMLLTTAIILFVMVSVIREREHN